MTRLVFTTILVSSLILTAAGVCPQLAAQIAPHQSLEELTTNSNDPTAILAQLKIEDDYTTSQFHSEAEPNTLVIQPVIPVRPFWFIPWQQLLRPTFKVATIPNGPGPSTNTQFGDTQFLDLFVARRPDFLVTGLRWGVGPYLVVPTATTRAAGSGTWQIGPAAAATYRGIPGLLVGGLFQQGTSFAYTAPDRRPVTQLTFQPFFVYQLGQGWYLRSRDATWTFNLRHNTSTEISLSAGIGKVWQVAEDRDINASIVGEWITYRQFDPKAPQFILKFQITVILPRVEL